MDLARLTVRLEAQSAQLLTELERANKKIDNFASSTQKTLQNWAGAVVAVFSVSAIVDFTKGVLDAGERMHDLSIATNLSVETLSGLGYAASQSGSSLDDVAVAMQKLASKAADAAAGNKEAKASFDTLGVSVTKADGSLKSIDQIFLEVADGFARHADGVAEAALAQDLFSKGGEKMLEFLNLGRVGIEALTDKAARLGLIMSTETATAADEFKGNLETLSTVVSANLGAALGRLLPQLVSISNALIELVANGDGVTTFADVVTNSFRVMITWGYGLAKTFEVVGRTYGAFAAYVDKVFTLDFAGARAISDQYEQDSAAGIKASTDFLSKLWGDTGTAANEAANEAVRATAAVLAANRALAANMVAVAKTTADAAAATKLGELQEVKITLKKIDLKPVDELYKALQEQTKTQSERQVEAYNADLTALKVLLGAKQISIEKYNERLAEIQDTFLPEFEVTLKKVQEVSEKAVVELSEFQKEAARNTQDIIADTLTGIATGADISAKSILKSFGEMIIKLTAQAVAADLAGKLFGEAGGGAKGSSGWIGLAMAAFTGGGSRDSGGRGKPGMEYLIGTGAQPERFVPDRPGTFIPAGLGGTQVTNHFTVQTEQPVTRRTQMQIAAAASRGVSRANRRNN